METGWPFPATDVERLARLRLYRTRNVGPATFRTLLNKFGSAEKALDALPELARRGGQKKFTTFTAEDALRQIDDTQQVGGTMLHLGEPRFPKLLAAAEDSPPILNVLGKAEILSRPSVAIVGARNASANGRTLATTFAMELASAGFVIVSSMARGIDPAAHIGALEGGTVAVLAGGIDNIYPRENSALYKDISDNGVIISEMATGTKPQGRHFPRRNRIISGLASAVVVIEAAKRSGSLTTARFAGEQGRDVLAVPGSPLDPRSHGTGKLIREGATLVMSSSQILEAIRQPYPTPIPNSAFVHVHHKDISESETTNLENTPQIHNVIIDLASPSPTPVDEIIRRSNCAPATVKAALLDLEVAGRIRHLSGNLVALSGDD